MNNKIKLSLVIMSSLAIGFSLSNAAFSDALSNYKVAVVDVQKVVNSSSQVAALKKDHQAKTQDLVKFVEKARADVAAASDEKTKKSLEDKYNKELVSKKEAIDKNYTTKLTEIDNSISKQIEAQAKAASYNLVLSKGVVLYGGTDITDAVIKVVK